MKTFIISLIAFTFCFTLSAEQIKLEDVIKKGIRINTESKNLSIQEKIDELNKEIIEKKKLFTINLSGTYLLKSDIMSIVFPETVLSPTQTIPGKQIDAGEYHNFDINLSLLQPIYTGNIISNRIKLKKNEVKITKNNSIKSNFQISGKIKYSYFKYMILKTEINILSVLLEELELHKNRLQNLHKENLIGIVDIIDTDLKIDEIKLNIEELQKNLNNEKHEFKYISGTDIEKINKNYSETIPDKQNAFLHFKKNHPSLKNISINNQNIELQKNISNGSYRPQVNGFVNFHYGKPGIDFFNSSWSPYVEAGINISYKVFDWNKQKKEKRILDFLDKKLENNRLHFIDIINKNLNILYITKQQIETKILKIRKMIKKSKIIKDLKNKLFIEKQISNIELLTYIQKTKKHQILEKKAQFNLELVKARINTLIGKI